jgi:hypothetical protein
MCLLLKESHYKIFFTLRMATLSSRIITILSFSLFSPSHYSLLTILSFSLFSPSFLLTNEWELRWSFQPTTPKSESGLRTQTISSVIASFKRCACVAFCASSLRILPWCAMRGCVRVLFQYIFFLIFIFLNIQHQQEFIYSPCKTAHAPRRK